MPHTIVIIDQDADTPLHHAAWGGYIEICQLLIKQNTDINVQNMSGNTPLHCAARNGHLEVVKCLIKHKANVNIKNNNGWTPLNENGWTLGTQNFANLEIANLLNGYRLPG